ncbi:MAG: type III-B CRISPR-associated protein Cas10/Cmr2 [Chloroflexi bacterium]|nr:type III-B CRISPR-associated protein Cas10/Cmr2 [Chloroflexota bacterium]
MPEAQAVLIFTFGPVQSFIAEARRASDLFAASRILVALATAAARAVRRGGGALVYPAAVSAASDAPNKPECEGDGPQPEHAAVSAASDAPNKLVAVVPREQARACARAAEQALLAEWQRLAGEARQAFRQACAPSAPVDHVWQQIWERQTASPWEVFWAAAGRDGRSYADAYREASRALEATKRTRAFDALDEPGPKDTLSGRREALHTAGTDARAYWQAAAEATTPARLRPRGRERLDALGLARRFSPFAEPGRFPSTSTVASADFLDRARPHLAGYRQAVEALLGRHLYRARNDPDWPYDGDLLYLDTLADGRLEDSYHLARPDRDALRQAQAALSGLYDRARARPSPYYAAIVLDGDDMGKRLNKCLAEPDPRAAHHQLSLRLAQFSDQVPSLVASEHACLVYNGGDDVLLLAPLARALPTARALAQAFAATTGGSASAGIAVAHHLYPLDATLRAAREAETHAKQVPGKAAVCVRVLRRSGETTEARGPWAAVGEPFGQLVKLFADDALASRFAYDAAGAAYAFPQAGAAFAAELKRLLARHRAARHPDAPVPAQWAERLHAWATHLPEGTEGLGRWLVLARFVAQGGGE